MTILKRKRLLTSWVWEYFESVDSENKVICQICESSVTFSGPTTTLSHHLLKHHKITKMTISKENNQIKSDDSGEDGFEEEQAKRDNLNKKRARFSKNVANFIINNNLPIITVDKPDFIKLFDRNSPPICKKTLTNVIFPEMVNFCCN